MKDKNVQTKININVDKLPENSFWNLQQHKYLIALNVHKAYDSIMLYILDQFIQNDPYFTNSEKEQWQEELEDLSALNLDISGNIIYRSQGIPQDSELAPYLLNYYISRILEDPIIIKLLKDCEFTIYADNIFIANNFDNEEICRKLVVNLNYAFNNYNFSFKREYKIIKIDGFGFPNEIIKTDELDNYQSKKTIGMKFNIIDNPRKFLNFNEVLFKLKYKLSNSCYKMTNIAKRYIIDKILSYFIFLLLLDLKQVYKDWFKRELRNWLKANLVTIKIADNMIEHILVNIVKFSYLDIGSNKIKSNFNKNLLDIYDNKCEIISINYISKNNLINKDFNINKNNLKNILKIKKIT